MPIFAEKRTFSRLRALQVANMANLPKYAVYLSAMSQTVHLPAYSHTMPLYALKRAFTLHPFTLHHNAPYMPLYALICGLLV